MLSPPSILLQLSSAPFADRHAEWVTMMRVKSFCYLQAYEPHLLGYANVAAMRPLYMPRWAAVATRGQEWLKTSTISLTKTGRTAGVATNWVGGSRGVGEK